MDVAGVAPQVKSRVSNESVGDKQTQRRKYDFEAVKCQRQHCNCDYNQQSSLPRPVVKHGWYSKEVQDHKASIETEEPEKLTIEDPRRHHIIQWHKAKLFR